MEHHTSPAIVLKSTDYQERDQLVRFLTADHGTLSGIVKGSRKLTSRGVADFSQLSCGIMHYRFSQRSELVHIIKCDPHPPYLLLNPTYEKICFSAYLADIIRTTSIGANEAAVSYNLLKSALERICTSTQPRHLPLIKLGFELRYLMLQGWSPNWTRCVYCEMPIEPASPPVNEVDMVAEGDDNWIGLKNPQSAAFDVELGGAACEQCLKPTHSLPFSATTLAFLCDFYNREAMSSTSEKNLLLPTLNTLTELDDILKAHLQQQMGQGLKSARFLPRFHTL